MMLGEEWKKREERRLMNWVYCGMSISAGVMATAKTDFLFKSIKSIVSKTNKMFCTSFVYKCGVWTERELSVRRVKC